MFMRKKTADVSRAFQFAWEVPKSGYRVENCYRLDSRMRRDGKAEPMLVEPTPSGISRMIKIRRPLKESTGLFLEFADMNLTPDAVVRFANQHGTLGKPLTQMVAPSGHGAKFALHGVPIAAWFAEVSAIRQLVSLWDPLRKPEITFKTTPECIRAESASVSENFVFRSADPDTYEQLENKATAIAQHYLRTKVNAKLLEYPSAARLVFDEIALCIVPTSLIAAIWLQFARVVAGDHQYHICKNCKRWFEVGGGVRREDAETCSDSCRAAFAYRNKTKGKKR